MPSRRGSAAPARAGSEPRRPCSSASSQAMIDARTRPPPRQRNGSGGSFGTRRVDERQARPARRRRRARATRGSGRRASSGRRRCRSSRRRSGSACRAPCRRTGRWSAETSIGPPQACVDLRRPRARAAVAAGRARRARPSARPARSAASTVPPKPIGPSRCPSARGRRSSCGSSGGTCGRRVTASPPVQPICVEQLGDRLGEHDVAAEGGQPPASGFQPGRPRVRRATTISCARTRPCARLDARRRRRP